MKITKRAFGTLSDGQAVHCWRIENEQGLCAEVLDYGATIRALWVPDRTGELVDVVLGYDTLEGYLENPGYLGATIGRFGNRIGGGCFTLNDKTYTLACNNGKNHLHGGNRGFDQHIWQAEETESGVLFQTVSPDGEEGYPGTLRVSVQIGWRGNALCLRYHAVCDQDTIVNLTNHSYFNLDGEGTVQEQTLMIHAQTFTPNDESCLPIGVIAPVEGTAVDFRVAKPIGRDADRDEACVRPFGGYDVNFVLLPGAPAAIAKSPKRGIVMTMMTDQPGVQLYTANQMTPRVGKNGQIYAHRSAFCLETQHYPDCVHHPDWPSCVLKAGETLDSETSYAFSVEA